MRNNTYSQKETELLDAFGIPNEVRQGLSIKTVYEAAALKAFKSNLCGPHVDSLRRILTYMEGINNFRGTPEFEKLIDLKKLQPV